MSSVWAQGPLGDFEAVREGDSVMRWKDKLIWEPSGLALATLVSGCPALCI